MKRLVVDASTLVSGVASRLGGGAPWLILLALLDLDFEAIVTGDRDLLDHPDLMPPAIDARGGCEFLGLLD